MARVDRAWAAAFLATLSVFVFISYLAYSGRLPHAEFFQRYDWFFHATSVGPIGATLDRALRGRAVRRVPLGPAIVLVAAGIEELLQQLSPRRSTTLHDYVSDVVGVVIFTWLARALARRTAR